MKVRAPSTRENHSEATLAPATDSVEQATQHPGDSPDRARSSVTDEAGAEAVFFAGAWRAHDGCFPCRTGTTRDLQDSQPVYPESFTSIVVAELLLELPGYRSIVETIVAMLEREIRDDGLFHFFKEHQRLPADADCSAMGLSILRRTSSAMAERAHRALDAMSANCNAQGVIETYFDPTGERSGRLDAVVCTNVLSLAYQLGRGREFQPTLAHVAHVLREREYLDGTRYYHSPDAFLFFAGRLVRRLTEAGDRETRDQLQPVLRSAVRERQGATRAPIDLAQRVILARWLDLDARAERQTLLAQRRADGAWPRDSLFRYGRRQIYFGSSALATAFAVRALAEE